VNLDQPRRMSETSVFAGDPAAGFSRFYRGLHARDDSDREDTERNPYLWQQRLARELIEGRPPEALQAPTGAGKTTFVEAFLFALAWQLHHGEDRTLPLRLLWVVDRRSVVDQVYRHAAAVAERVNGVAKGDRAAAVLNQVKLALARPGSNPPATQRRDDVPSVVCQCWRGGTGLRPTTLAPDSVAIVCSTVDQVGSRLLFRGYGTSRAARPIDAALVGTDSLIVIDEAHIAQPFVETAQAVAAAQNAAKDHPGRPLRTMLMSATLASRNSDEVSFRLTEGELGEPALARRVNAEKRVRIGQPARTRVSGLIAAARDLAWQPGLVGVVANTVGEARQVHAELSREYEPGRVLLLIGPNRPVFRDALIDAIPGRAERSEGRGPKLVVATQTIEVGVDLDFDALVTACAPLDALAQRLGRLDRAGTVGETTATIVHSKELCPVYGEATASTWALLREWAEDGFVRMGPRRINELLAGLSSQRRAETSSPERRAPLLKPWDIEALSQTSDDPTPAPEIALFLHGDETIPAAEVNVVWREDLALNKDLKPANDWAERVRARPPHSGESIPLPIGRVQAWLRGRATAERQGPDPLADVESVAAPEPTTNAETAPGEGDRRPPPFVLVTPDQRASRIEARPSIKPNEITPGATIVVPQSYGCCDEFGWIPGAEIQRCRSRPEDLGDLGNVRPCLLFPPVRALWPSGPEDRALADAAAETRSALERSCDETSEVERYKRLREPVLAWLRCAHQADAEPREQGSDGFLLESRRNLLESIEASEEGVARIVNVGPNTPAEPAFVLVPDLSRPDFPRARRPITLAEHSKRVAQHARRLATLTCTDEGVVGAVEVAAEYHDHGKLDPRFQRWMFLGEDPNLEAARAKSGISSRSRRSERARSAAGWPRHKRHESLSALLLARSSLASDGTEEAELMPYLIAVHHGRNRPFLPAEDPDRNPVEITAEIGDERVVVRSSETLNWATHASAFARLNRRFSPWGLALIESALVQADWLASREEQEGPPR
jgi:CRISPR-associated endonuclease/helicase Cas3